MSERSSNNNNHTNNSITIRLYMCCFHPGNRLFFQLVLKMIRVFSFIHLYFCGLCSCCFVSFRIVSFFTQFVSFIYLSNILVLFSLVNKKHGIYNLVGACNDNHRQQIIIKGVIFFSFTFVHLWYR